MPQDEGRVRHLLRRFGLGASEREVEYYGQDGLSGAIDRLLAFRETQESVELPIDPFRNNQNGRLVPRGVQAWWYIRLLTTRRPLEQRLTLFWHDHFAVSAQKVDSGPAMLEMLQILQAGCDGPFPELLASVSKSPAMLYWLDNHENVKGKPNENFAREVMELFTLGIGNYTEKDVQEAARAFTGWTFGVGRRRAARPLQGARFQFDAEKHDDTPKTILGRTEAFDGDAVLAMLSAHPQTSRYIVAKMWEWFAYPNPSTALVDRLAKKWRESGMKTSELVRAMAQSEEFYSPKAIAGVIKDPVLFCTSTLRQVGFGAQLSQRFAEALGDESTDPQTMRRMAGSGALVARATKSMGMELLFPPDVAGWNIGEAWISTATMIERMQWADRLFGGGQGVQGMRLPAIALVGPTADGRQIAERLVKVFDANLPAQKVEVLARTAQEELGKGGIGALQRAVQVSARALFAAPEFQLA